MCPFYIHVWSCIIRVQTAMQLQRNLGLRLSGAGLPKNEQLLLTPERDRVLLRNRSFDNRRKTQLY
jgi:hypothetical protein